MDFESYRGAGTRNYRASHDYEEAAAAYRKVYASGYYASQWSQLEKPLLARIFSELRANGSRRLLDLACGQGRVAIFGANYFDEVLGVDYSPQMLKIAEDQLKKEPLEVRRRVRFLKGDVREFVDPTPFDAVTAFRFFLNAEENLRHQGLRCIRRNLRRDGVLVANIHVSGTSPLAMVYRLSRLTRRIRRLPPDPVRNYISVGAFKTLLASEGFAIDRVHRYSFLPRLGTWTDGLADRYISRLDSAVQNVHVLSILSQSYLICGRSV